MLRIASTFGLVGGIVLIFQPQNYIFTNTDEAFQAVNAETFLNLTNQISSQQIVINNLNLLNANSSQTSIYEISHKAEDDLLGCIFSVLALIFSATSAVMMKKSTQHFDKMTLY